MEVMLEMGILPTEKRAQTMSPPQWVMLHNYYASCKKDDMSAAKRILGVNLAGEDKMIPLATFINPELTTKLLEGKQEDEEREERMKKMTPEELDEEMRNIYETDIEMALTEEQKKKIADKDLAELIRVEKMAGIQEKK